MFVYLHSRCAEFAPGAVRSGGWRPPRKRGLRPAGTEGRGAGKVSARTRNEVAHAVAHAVAEAMKGLGLCCTGTRDGLYWSDGRVARQRSAKPCTAVRIRFRPQLKQRMLPESRWAACAEMAREQCRTAIFHQESPWKLITSEDFFFVRALISLGCFVIACNSAITRRQPARQYLRACPAPARCRQLKTSVFRFRNAEVF